MDADDQIPLSELNPSLAHLVEDLILFGRLDELNNLIEQIVDHPQVTDELRYGLEGLKYFREHYGTNAQMSPTARQRIAQFDTAWSMQLIDLLRGGEMREKEQMLA